MRTTRRGAILGALGIGVASRLPVEPTTPVLPTTTATPPAVGASITAAGGWCAPSEAIYDASLLNFNEYTWVAEALPEIKVRRGGITYGEQR